MKISLKRFYFLIILFHGDEPRGLYDLKYDSNNLIIYELNRNMKS